MLLQNIVQLPPPVQSSEHFAPLSQYIVHPPCGHFISHDAPSVQVEKQFDPEQLKLQVELFLHSSWQPPAIQSALHRPPLSQTHDDVQSIIVPLLELPVDELLELLELLESPELLELDELPIPELDETLEVEVPPAPPWPLELLLELELVPEDVESSDAVGGV